MQENRCERCGHHWIPRTRYRPQCCPHCNRRDWDEINPAKIKPGERRRVMKPKVEEEEA